MIELYIKSVDAQHQQHSFHCVLNELETVLDTLSLIAAAGNTFLEIYIVEDGHRTTLPPQAFDGQNITKPLQHLQRQWVDLLASIQAESGSCTRSGQMDIEVTLDLIDHYESLMADFDSSIVKLQRLLVQAETWLTNTPRKNQLIGHYSRIIARHHQFMGDAQIQRDKYLIKLTKLKLVALP